jgi:hypothetical protein
MCDKEALLAEMHAFVNRTGMKPSYFGKQACGNSEVMARLNEGGDVYTGTAERIRKFMANYETTRATNQEASPAQP